jgi:hypothetical protein
MAGMRAKLNAVSDTSRAGPLGVKMALYPIET